MFFRSRDAVVLIWDLQNPPTESDQFASHSSEPVTVEIKSMQSSCDLTSLEWNPSGTLLAIGSYDSMLRICTSTGAVYFTHPQHQVGTLSWQFCCRSQVVQFVSRRVLYLLPASQNQGNGSLLPVWMGRHVCGT